MASTDALHPLVAAAAGGELPPWAEATPERRAHIARVAALMDGWSRALGLEARDAARWRAAGWLHDALRDADPETLRAELPPELRDVPAPLVHGPAAAERLAAAGVDDAPLLDAVRWHTLGHGRLERLGRALYLADFLEPGRSFSIEWRASLRAGMPAGLDAVLREVVAARIRHLVEERRAIRPETLSFWNSLATAPSRP